MEDLPTNGLEVRHEERTSTARRVPEEEPEGAPPKKRSQAERVIGYALGSGAELFVDQMGAPHALVEDGVVAVALDTRCYTWLRGLMWDEEWIPPGSEALKTASGMLASLAEMSGDERELHTRAAFHEGAVYYWLGKGRVAKIDRDGWEVVKDPPPVLFRRVLNLKELPDPERGSSLDVLDELVNLKTERDKRMFRAYLVTLALAHIPRPILQTTGVMGSGKTTASRVVKRLLDPTSPEAVRMDPKEFLQKASHCHIVMLDNLSGLTAEGVDILCRLCTGEADSKRGLYTNDEDFIYEMKRAVLLNGINAPTQRGDAQDRTLPVELERIPDDKRRSERGIWETFDKEHGKLLGAIFEALSGALREKETLRLSRRPRLADWGEYAAAAYEALGWGAERFLEDWDAVVVAQNQDTLDGSALAQVVLAFMEGRGEEYTASSSVMYANLQGQAETLKIDVKRDKSWPGGPNWLWKMLKEVLPLLSAHGIDATRGSRGKKGSSITFKRLSPEPPPKGGSIEALAVTDAVTDAVTPHPAYLSHSDPGDSSVSISGGFSPSLPRSEEDKDENGHADGIETHTGRGVPENAYTAVTAVTGELSGLAQAIRYYHETSLDEDQESPGQLAVSLFKAGLYPSEPTPEQVAEALEELPPETL